MGATTTLQEAKQYLVSRIRTISEEILPGWYLDIAFATKGPRNQPHSMLEGFPLMYIDGKYIRHALKRGVKAYRLVINEYIVRDNMYNIQALDVENNLIHELEHTPDSYAILVKHKNLMANLRLAKNKVMAKRVSIEEYKRDSSKIIRKMKSPEPHSVERYRQAVKERTGSVVDSLPAVVRVSEMAFVGAGEAMAPVAPRFLYRCPACGNVGAYTPELYKPVVRRTKAGGTTMHYPKIGEGARCENCGRFMPADTKAIKMTHRERAELWGLAREHEALPYKNLAKQGLPFNYPLYTRREMPIGKIPTPALMKAIPRIRSIL